MTGHTWFISYAVPAHNNEMVIGLPGLHFGGPPIATFDKSNPVIKLNVMYRFTVTLKGSKLLMFWDGKLHFEKQVNKVRNSIRAGGSWIIGQEQDSVLGGFEASQRFIGSICGLKMWNEGLDKEEAAEFFKYSITSSKPSMFDSPPSYTYELKDGALYKA